MGFWREVLYTAAIPAPNGVVHRVAAMARLQYQRPLRFAGWRLVCVRRARPSRQAALVRLLIQAMTSPDKSSSSAGRLIVFGSTVLLFAALALFWSWRRSHVEAPSAPPENNVMHKIVGEAVKPPPPPNDYVGSAACAQCHAAIAESYREHPMYRSAGRTPGEDDVEDFSDGEFTFDDGRIYRVVKEDDGIYHHEIARDRQGEVIYDEAAKISFFIGSGARGKSYAVDRDGLLFESPISWFSSAGKWDISPGYGHRHLRFGRRIQEECVLCHAGRASVDHQRETVFSEPVLLESAIGCERCHGPGQRHMELHKSDNENAVDDPIVNPARLGEDRREAVCYQCHLIGKMTFKRYGRHADDFRPGDRLDDVWAIFVAGTGVRGDRKTKAVSHVVQMRDSVCYQKSDGRLGCISCHDAHSVPAKSETDGYYRQRCLECHAEQGCSLPAEQQAAAPANNSCIHCHMPRLSAHDIAHASQTDHRILRDIEAVDDAQYLQESPELVLFDRERTVMPEWEVERAIALSKARRLQEAGYAGPTEAEQLERTLRDITEIAADDADSWTALGVIYDLRQNIGSAREALERALALKPQSENVLDLLVRVCQKSGDSIGGLEYLDRLLAQNPWRSLDYMRRSTLLSQLGRQAEAVEAAEKAVELDPTDRSARRWAIKVAQSNGDMQTSRRHAEILRRLSE